MWQIVGLGTDRRNPDVPTLAVMNDILGGGFASRLFQKVRTELGLAYAVGGGLPSLRPSGLNSASWCSPRAPPPWTQPTGAG
jgi:predicted Zn-dependent peptidase